MGQFSDSSYGDDQQPMEEDYSKARSGIFRRRKSWILALCGLIVAGGGFFAAGGPSLFGQKLEQRLTDFHKTYDGWWDVACDRATDGSDGRCYVQYVDVYSPRPNFRAAMLEVTYSKASENQSVPQIVFNIERDLDFRDVEMAVTKANGQRVAISIPDCSGAACVFDGADAKALLDSLEGGQSLDITLTESNGQPAKLQWPLGKIDKIMNDFNSQRKERGYP